MRRILTGLILLVVTSILLFGTSLHATESKYRKTAKELRNHYRPQYQAEYVRGLLDAFRFVADTGINLNGIVECHRKDDIGFVGLPYDYFSFMKAFMKRPERFYKSLHGIDFLPRPAVESFVLVHMNFCEDDIEKNLNQIKSLNLKRYLLSGTQLINAARPQYDIENMFAFMDAFTYLSQTDDRHTDIIECHRNHQITWFDVTGVLIRFINRPSMFGSFAGDRNVKAGPAVEAFVLMNRKWCAQLDEFERNSRQEEKKQAP
jgi:hypothetical protein